MSAQPIQSTKSDEPVGFTVRGIIAMAGGTAAVAEKCGLSFQAVNGWERRIPDPHARTVAIMAGLPLAVVRPDHVKGVGDA